MLSLDHLVVSGPELGAAVEAVRAALDMPLQPGGEHALFGTHNQLLGLNDGIYLEAIAPNPSVPSPDRARWYDLDRVSGAPRLSHWACACPDLEAALALCPNGAGVPTDVTRGDLSWRMAVPATGVLPFDDCFPALLQWKGDSHPAQRLAPTGLRLTQLTVTHPEATALREALAPLISDARLVIEPGAPGLSAKFDGPRGPVVL